ncbi:hypothetical protein MPER_01340, partial [Moniliophthora perniciosa FA553]
TTVQSFHVVEAVPKQFYLDTNHVLRSLFDRRKILILEKKKWSHLVCRINNVSAFFSSCTMGLLLAITLSSFIFTADPKGELSISSVKVYPSKTPRYPKRKQEMAFVNFNISAG